MQNTLILKDYLNNQKKLYNVIRKLIGVKKSLFKVMLNEEGESLIEPINETTVLKNCSYKESVYEGADVFQIECINFGLMKDIEYLIEKTYELNLIIKKQGLEQLEMEILK